MGVRRVSEQVHPSYVSHGEDTPVRGLEEVVHHDTAPARLHPRRLEPESLDVRGTARGHQDLIGGDRALHAIALEADLAAALAYIDPRNLDLCLIGDAVATQRSRKMAAASGSLRGSTCSPASRIVTRLPKRAKD